MMKSVTLAANDGYRAAWQEWLMPALADNPDLDALNDSGGPRFQSIDTKLSIALTHVINQAGEAGQDVQMQLRQRTQLAGRQASFVMGREILAMILSHFKTPGLRNTLFTMEHLYKMQYFGDSQLDQFYHRWMEMNNNMLPDDIPPDNWLRDCLFKKIRGSHVMMFGIKQYESWEDGDNRKTYQHLRYVIERTIARTKEDKQTTARDKYAREYAGSGKPTIPAPTTPTPKAGQEAAPVPKAKEKATPKPKPKADAAPVLPSPQPKQHAKGKGKGKGTPRNPSRSASPSPKHKKKIPCHFHFVKHSCKHGKDCAFSHDQKVFDNFKKGGGKGKGKSKSPRKRTPSNPPKKIDEPCWNWAKGKCKYGDSCRRRHDPHLFNTAPNANVPASPALVYDSDSDDDVTSCYKAASTTRTSGRRVQFDMKKIDQVEYVKEDYIPCHGKAPRYTPHDKVGKSTQELKQDDQLAYSNRLAIVRARAMAFSLSRTEEHINIDEVHIVIGPKIDINIPMMIFDGYDDVDEIVFRKEYIPHIPGKFGLKGNVMCITVPVEERDKKFIMDSGSGHDLIAQKKVDRMDIEMYEDETVNFHTANGVTSTSKMTDLQFNVFEESVKAHVLEDTPSVLSMGKRCLDQGYTFIWPSGKDPFMIDNNGMMISMNVKDHIPYVNLDQAKEHGNVEKIKSLLEILNDDCSTSDGENTLIIDGESGDEMIENEKNQTSSLKNNKKRRSRSKRTKVDQYDVAVGDVEEEEDELHEMEDNDDEDDAVRSQYEPDLAEEMQELEHDVEVDDEHVGDEDDEDVIDVDEEDGEPRLSKRGALKHEAKSKDHLLTHRFKNPYCESCVRAKMKHRKTFRGALQRKLTKFGDLVTFDYVGNRQIYEHDYGVEKTIFVIRDRYTGVIQAYPSAKKDQEAVKRAVKQFMGRKIREAYSDMAPQFIEAMKALKIPMDHSLAGKTKHNSLAKRHNQFLLVATTTCWKLAFIHAFWRYAIRCVSHLLNVEPNDQEVSSWCKLHGEDFKGLLIPFGALVYFKPSGARNVEQKHKFDPMGIPGVFAGYDLAPGLHWWRKYRVWALSDWAKQNLSYDTMSPIRKLKTPHDTERVELKEPLEFPCKLNYERINVTIDGLKEKERLDGSPDYIPLPEPEDHDGGDDDGDDQGDDHGGGPDGGGDGAVDPSILGELEKMEREGAEDVARRAELTPPPGLGIGSDEPPRKDKVYIEVLEHYTEGKSGDGKIYLNDDGERVKIDKGGRNYRVDDRGFRKFHNTPRPDRFTPDEWRRIPHEKRNEIKKAQEMEVDAAIEKRKLEMKVKEAEDLALKKLEEDKKKKKKKDGKGASGSKDKHEEHDVGVTVKHEYVRHEKVFHYGSKPIPSSGRLGDNAVVDSVLSDTDVPDDEDFLVDWEEKSEIENGFGPKATWTKDKGYDFESGRVVVAAPRIPHPKDTTHSDDLGGNHSFPCLPCVSQDNTHREKIEDQHNGININKLFNTAVSRPVGRKEMMEDEDARKSMRKEWLGQHAAGVYDFSIVREYDDVVSEAKKSGKEVHMARIHGICVEKNYQLPKGHPNRKFKGRSVLLGNQVKNQFWEAAFFQDLGNSPATFEASRWADFYGCLPGNDVKLADAIQAYIQTILTGPPCWVELPEDAWPDDVDFRKFRRPVVRLVKALYGHPDSGTMWEQHCDRKVKELDFIPVGEEWPSMYFS